MVNYKLINDYIKKFEDLFPAIIEEIENKKNLHYNELMYLCNEHKDSLIVQRGGLLFQLLEEHGIDINNVKESEYAKSSIILHLYTIKTDSIIQENFQNKIKPIIFPPLDSNIL
ncbi:hypothetical protein GCM10022423_29640 [Flavobacterium ginsengiterrae]|uniref:Uncharacterized protein n=1 Tax=Flavobacterium ginsengiterrae TaxID=871695 RepID=A0ABP7GSJ1_9FLAO